MAYLELQNLSKSYGSGANAVHVLQDVNLQIEEGEFIAIVGFSGSGKTTLISTIAGLIQPDAGQVVLQGEVVEQPSAERGVIFQSYSLMPWFTVFDNIALGVDAVLPKLSKTERQAHIERYIDMVGLSHATHLRPAELSGGMRQRVAVARALATNPKVLLMDEPLSALDALTRAKLQDEIESIWRSTKKTVILITNDVDEAILLADRIVPLTPGPKATLGPEFRVSIERPRDRTVMNHNDEFKRLRAEITGYLLDANKQQLESSDVVIQLPSLLPNTATEFEKDAPREIKNIAKNLGKERYVEFYNVGKTYPTPKGPAVVVEDFNVNLKKGEFISIIGHSGCGKSTVLSMVAGLNDITDGGIVLDNKEVTTAGPDRGVVFQAPSLFPWLTAYENVELGVKRVYPHATQAERKDIIEYYLSRVGLAGSMRQKASELSNGMQQRVGIARAFALSPKLLLLDEPFGMLDSLTRWDLQEVLMEVWERTHVTAVMVTHDVDEAILLADRVIMMTNGPRAKVGKIMEVPLPRPRTRQQLLEHPQYYELREELIGFLEEYERGPVAKTVVDIPSDATELSDAEEEPSDETKLASNM